jgi:phage terminase small subunit
MPRKSAASLSVVPNVDGQPNRIRPRADVPASLRQIINDLVASVPPEHFRSGDAALLEQYAQAIALARQAYAELEKKGPVINGRASPWIAVLEKTHRSAVALAARLRLSPQSRIDPKTVGRKAGPPPSYYDQMRLEQSDAED